MVKSLIPEGVTIFKILSVNLVGCPKSHLAVTMVTANGQRHIQRFYVYDDDGNFYGPALTVFKIFAEKALHHRLCGFLGGLEELPGSYIQCDVVHNVVPTTYGDKTYASINQYSYKSAWDFNG